MPRDSKRNVTDLLVDWRRGDHAALEHLIPIVYDELRRVARARLRSEGSDTLQTTALVHEAYLRLVDLDRMTLRNRTHFFAMAARLMREIVVDHARRRHALKRGGDLTVLGLDGVVDAGAKNNVVEVLVLDEALTELASFDQRAGRVVELRFFAGLSIAETAEALDVSSATVERDWTVAKAWLLQRLAPNAHDSGDDRRQ